MASYRMRKKWRHRVAHLTVLVNEASGEMKSIREGLQPCRLSNTNHPVLIVVEEGSPMRVAFCQNRA